MYVYPVDARGAAARRRGRSTPRSRRSRSTVDPDEITENRAEWLREWRDITSR